MLRLLKIEYLKVKNTTYFWVFFSLFLAFLLALPIFSKMFLDYLAEQGEKLSGFPINSLPFYDFIDIWQNMTFLYKFASLLPAFIIIISVSNEYRYGTIKQNIIDGLSRNELLLSKILFAIVFSAVISIAVFIIGLWMGFMWSPVTDAQFIFQHVEFIFAYFLVLVGFQIFCLMVTLIIKKPGITILLLLFYFIPVEGFSYAWVKFNMKMVEATSLFPLRGMANVISNPFPKYVLQEVYSTVRLRDVLQTMAHIGLYTGLSFWVFNKKDIR